MKINKFLTYCLCSAAVAASLTACEDEVTINQGDAPSVEVPGEVVYVTDNDGKRIYTSVELRDTKDVPLYVNTPKSFMYDCDVAFVYDATAVDEYNAANGTSYEAVPESMVTLSNGGETKLQAGTQQSEPMTVTITSDGSLDHGKGYAVPLRVSVKNGEAALTRKDTKRLIFVRDLTGLPDATKYVLDADGNEIPAVRTMYCMEVNDMNPLEVSSYTLKNSGKSYYDAVMLFAANINYNAETGRVYVSCNENVSAILANRDHYLQPLQDRGIKVYLSILGNHDISNIDCLSDETARYFAQELKAYCDVYKLDGVFYNSEYGGDGGGLPGFVRPSYAAAARLFYEVKKIQPERDNIIYTYDFSSLPSVDGAQPGEFMDFIWTNYSGGPINPDNFPGVPKFNLGHYSWEFTQGNTYGDLSRLRSDGYGLHVHFGNRMRQYAMQNSARLLYDDELVYDGKTYTKDWL